MNYLDKENIINDYGKFITYVLKKMNLMHRYDELFDVGMIGFTKGIKKYKEDKNCKCSTFLFDCVKQEIIRFLDSEQRLKRKAELYSLNKKINDDSETELVDLIPFCENYEEKIFFDDVIREIMIFLARCPKRQEDIFKYIYGVDGYPMLTIVKIAKKFNTCTQSIHETHKRLMKKIRIFLKKKGFYER